MDAWQKCSDIQTLEETQERVSIRYTYIAPAMPSLKAEVTYTVNSTGCMKVEVHYFGMEGRPGLPLFGLRLATPVPAEQVEWVGLSGETYLTAKRAAFLGSTAKCPTSRHTWCPRSAAAIWTPTR